MSAHSAPIWLLLLPAWSLAEWHAAAYLGGARTADTRVEIRHAADVLRFDDVPFRGRSFESPLYYGYRVGYFFSDRLGVDGEFIHQKVYAEVDERVWTRGTLHGQPVAGLKKMNEVVQRFSISHGLNLVLANLALRHPVGRLSIVARSGLGFAVPHAESTVLGLDREQYEVGGVVLQLAGGGEVRFWRGLHALIEYKFTRTGQNVDISGGSALARFRSHHVAAGVSWHF